VAEIDPDALITASQGAELAGVTVAAVCNWVTRGYLKPAQRNGRTVKDGRGRPLYRLLDVAKAEAATSKAARRVA
jgi:DNA-binding transcriptional MerR regulator